MSDLIPLPEAARRFGRTPSAFVQAVRRGRLPATRIGRVHAVTIQDAADYVASVTTGRPPSGRKGGAR